MLMEVTGFCVFPEKSGSYMMGKNDFNF